ncbi:MAG: hypothetical protein ABR969_07445 [Sedimentisphaerales bacterium]
MIMPLVETILRTSILALTPVQRWQAVKNIRGSNFTTERWFTLTCVTVIIVLTVLLFVVSYIRIRRERKNSENLFIEYAKKIGLTASERQTLLEVARKAGLTQSESIFTLATAFDLGSAQMIKKLVGKHAAKETQHLEAVLSSLREKLGFKKEASFSRGSLAKSEKLSSRQIPVGKEIYVIRPNARDSEAVEATVVKNDNTELTVQLTKPVTITFGEYWNVRYYYGSSIWEFESYIVSYDGNTMVLSHSDEVRFINRRRFLRAPVQKPAFIASFPFERKLTWSTESSTEKGKMSHDFPQILLKPLQFVPAVVTELGGPGLRIEAPIEVKTGDRVLVMFELDREKERKLIKDPETGEVIEISTTVMKIIENVGMVEEIGEVRRTEDMSESLSMAVELTGLRDSDIDCLIQATNAASISVGDRNKNMQTSENTGWHPPVRMGI